MRRFFHERRRKKEIEGISALNENNITIRKQIKKAESNQHITKNDNNFDFLLTKNAPPNKHNVGRFVSNHNFL